VVVVVVKVVVVVVEVVVKGAASPLSSAQAPTVSTRPTATAASRWPRFVMGRV
jgi:hypothetical protein